MANKRKVVAPGATGTYAMNVFDFHSCSIEECHQVAFAGSAYCRQHHPDSHKHEALIIEAVLNSRGDLESQDYSGIDFSDCSLSGKVFRYCRLSGCRFINTDLSESHFLMCLMEEITAEGAQFTGSRMMSMMAASGYFRSVDFSGSDLININFNGLDAQNCKFDESDLYYSRFINSRLSNVSFRDCNLKRVDFSAAHLSKIDFTDSNPEEAYIEQEKSL